MPCGRRRCAVSKHLHYCWFGRGEKSDLIRKCIASWHEQMPDAEITEWNEDNFDLDFCPYVREAYDAKKWAFVSDVCRFYVLSTFGGIYLDTDVELLRPLDDLPDTFAAFETPRVVASGLVRGALPGDEISLAMLDSYRADHFLLSDGTENTLTVCVRETALFTERGLLLNGKTQTVAGVTVYAPDFFCPLNYTTGKLRLTENTRSIHHYSGTWESAQQKYTNGKRQKLCRFLPKKFAGRVAFVLGYLKYQGLSALIRYQKNKKKKT